MHFWKYSLFASMSFTIESMQLEGKDCVLPTFVSPSLAQCLAFNGHSTNICWKVNYSTQRGVFPAFPHNKQEKKGEEVIWCMPYCALHFVYVISFSDRWKPWKKQNCVVEKNKELLFLDVTATYYWRILDNSFRLLELQFSPRKN